MPLFLGGQVPGFPTLLYLSEPCRHEPEKTAAALVFLRVDVEK
jgi:hypothetical protein